MPILQHWFARAWQRWVRAGTTEEPERTFGDLSPTLRHNLRQRISILLFFPLLLSLCVYSWIRPEEFEGRSPWLLWFVRVALTVTNAIGVWEAAEAFRHKIEVGESGLTITPPLSRTRQLAWADISLVLEQPRKERLVLVSRSGERYPISEYLNGFNHLRARLRRTLAEDRWSFLP